MALFAVVLALCSEADAFVAASLTMLPLLPRLVFPGRRPGRRRRSCRPCRRGCSAGRSRSGSGRRRSSSPRSSRPSSVWCSLAVRGEPRDTEHAAPARRAERRGDGDQGQLPALREAGAAAVAARGRRRVDALAVASIVRDLRHAACRGRGHRHRPWLVWLLLVPIALTTFVVPPAARCAGCRARGRRGDRACATCVSAAACWPRTRRCRFPTWSCGRPPIPPIALAAG